MRRRRIGRRRHVRADFPSAKGILDVSFRSRVDMVRPYISRSVPTIFISNAEVLDD